MAHYSENSNPIHQSATAGFQLEPVRLQSPFDSHSSFNSGLASSMASRSTEAFTTLNIPAQADSIEIDMDFAGNNQHGQNSYNVKFDGLELGNLGGISQNELNSFSAKFEGMKLSNPHRWAYEVRQISNAVTSWLGKLPQRLSGEMVSSNVKNGSGESNLSNLFSNHNLSASEPLNLANSLVQSPPIDKPDRPKSANTSANVFVDHPIQLTSFIADTRPASFSLPDGIQTKPEVNIDNLVPEMQAILPDIVQAYEDSGIGFSPLISSGNDGRHSPNSAHYKNMAIDLSSHDADYSDYMTASQIKTIAQEITNSPLKSTPVSGDPGRLQSNWDRDGDGTRDYIVIVEKPGVRGQQHIHIQLDPDHSINTSDLKSNPQESGRDSSSLPNPSSIPDRLFQYKGSSSMQYDPNVKAWQARMRERGWKIDVDGYYGPKSERVARQFQEEKRLSVDGIVGPETWKASFDTTNITLPGLTASSRADEIVNNPVGSSSQINAEGLQLLKDFEGSRLEAYRDPVGKWTIGYGHTGPEAKPGNKITQAQAESLLKSDLQRFESAVQRLVTVPLNENQFSALASFSFNVGDGALQNSTLLRKLNQRDYSGAANEFSRWVYGGNEVLPGLILRRQAEQDLFSKPA